MSCACLRSVAEHADAGHHHRDPESSAAAMTSGSRTDPPGWMIARTPAAPPASTPSAEGEESIRRQHRARGRMAGLRAPCAPRGTTHPRGSSVPRRCRCACSPRASRMAFDLTVPPRAQANRRSFISSSVGCAVGDHAPAVFAMDRRRTGPGSGSRRGSSSSRARLAARMSGSSTTRRFFFSAKARQRVGVERRRHDDFHEEVGHRIGGRTVDHVLKAITEPNADGGIGARARSNASAALRPRAMPHGVVCLMMAHATRLVHAADGEHRRVDVEQVVERSSLPCRWARSPMPRGSSVDVEGGALLRDSRRSAGPGAVPCETRRRAPAAVSLPRREVPAIGVVVVGGVGEDLRGQLAASVEIDRRPASAARARAA